MTLREVQELGNKRPDQEFVLNRFYGRIVSPYLTVLCLRLGFSPDQVTLLGGAFGAAGIALLFLPLGWWSAVAVACLQVGYILDFSDGQVARLTGRTSDAGSYLDRLTHLYVPVGAAFATASSLAWSSESFIVLVLGAMAALELAAFAFAGKEHILIAMLRDDPELGRSREFQVALYDDARPTDVLAADGEAGSIVRAGIPGRRHGPSIRSIIGELLIYPGAAHLLTVAVVLDLAVRDGLPVPARAGLLAAWAVLLVVHVPIAVLRNHRLIRAVESRYRRQPGPRETETSGRVGS